MFVRFLVHGGYEGIYYKCNNCVFLSLALEKSDYEPKGISTPMNKIRKSILIIDDEALMRELLADLFAAENFEVYTAEEGGAGMSIVESVGIDLLITDLIMPGKEGIETIHAVKSIRPEMKIIVMSGASRYLELARPFGIDAVIQKPFRNQDMLDLVQSVLGSDPV